MEETSLQNRASASAPKCAPIKMITGFLTTQILMACHTLAIFLRNLQLRMINKARWHDSHTQAERRGKT